MSGKILQLAPSVTEPNRRIVELLECHLARAKSGELQTLAIVAVTTNVTTLTDFVPEQNSMALLGGVGYVQKRIADWLDGSDKPN